MKLGAVCLLAAVAVFAGAAEAKAAQPVLRLGSRGSLVASWQRAMNLWLSDSGYAADKRLRARLRGGLVIDGVFGAGTRVVTERFQKEGQQPVTGTVGLSDWKSWIGAMVTPTSGPIGVRKGEFSGFVGWWQISLNRWLRAQQRREFVVDCSFGPQTVAATRAFQQAEHLAASGVVTLMTWRTAEHLNLTHLP